MIAQDTMCILEGFCHAQLALQLLPLFEQDQGRYKQASTPAQAFVEFTHSQYATRYITIDLGHRCQQSGPVLDVGPSCGHSAKECKPNFVMHSLLVLLWACTWGAVLRLKHSNHALLRTSLHTAARHQACQTAGAAARCLQLATGPQVGLMPTRPVQRTPLPSMPAGDLDCSVQQP